MSRPARFLAVVGCSILASQMLGVLVPVRAGTGPMFAGPFEVSYLANTDFIDVSGLGCPTTGGPPSSVAPSVVISLSTPGTDVIPGFPQVIGGQVVWETGDATYPDVYNVLVSLAPDGSWEHSMQAPEPSFAPDDKDLVGVCTALVEIADDGVSLDPDSLAAATFTSPAFTVDIDFGGGTTTTTIATTTTAPADPGSAAPPQSVPPTLTG